MTNQEIRWWILGFLELCDQPFDRHKIIIMKHHFNLVIAVTGSLDEPNRIIFDTVLGLLERNASDQEQEECKHKIYNIILHILGGENG